MKMDEFIELIKMLNLEARALEFHTHKLLEIAEEDTVVTREMEDFVEEFSEYLSDKTRELARLDDLIGDAIRYV